VSPTPTAAARLAASPSPVAFCKSEKLTGVSGVFIAAEEAWSASPAGTTGNSGRGVEELFPGPGVNAVDSAPTCRESTESSGCPLRGKSEEFGTGAGNADAIATLLPPLLNPGTGAGVACHRLMREVASSCLVTELASRVV
jgi:hypothetical protein